MALPQSIDSRAQAYGGAADAYERGRPEYPAAAVAHAVRLLGIGPRTIVLDVAAGTGKFTRQLAATRARLFALEPVAGMRGKLAAGVPGAAVVGGTAEAIPLRAASVDAVTVAQAFHWFRGQSALAEIRRVLKPGGGLALVWNVRDETVDWVRRLSELMDPWNGGAPRYHTGAWRGAFAGHTGFTALAVERFPFVHSSTPARLVDRAASTSFVAALPPEDRAGLLERVRRLLHEYPQTRGRERIPFPYVTEVYTCRKA